MLYLKTNKQEKALFTKLGTRWEVWKLPSQVASQQTHTLTPWTFASQINNTRGKDATLAAPVAGFLWAARIGAMEDGQPDAKAAEACE